MASLYRGYIVSLSLGEINQCLSKGLALSFYAPEELDEDIDSSTGKIEAESYRPARYNLRNPNDAELLLGPLEDILED